MAQDPTAVMGRRIGAVVIDGLVVLVPLTIIQTSQYQYIDKGSDQAATDYCTQYTQGSSGTCVSFGSTAYFTDTNSAWPALLLFGLPLLMFVILQGLTGWTLGKLITGIRTVQEDGRVVGIPRALVRWLFWIIDSLPVLWLVGLITSLTTTGHRRVGDMVAKTFVVDKRAVGQPVRVPGLAGSPPTMDQHRRRSRRRPPSTAPSGTRRGAPTSSGTPS